MSLRIDLLEAAKISSIVLIAVVLIVTVSVIIRIIANKISNSLFRLCLSILSVAISIWKFYYDIKTNANYVNTIWITAAGVFCIVISAMSLGIAFCRKRIRRDKGTA